MFPDVIAGSDGMLLQLAVGGETLAGIKASNEMPLANSSLQISICLCTKGLAFVSLMA